MKAPAMLFTLALVTACSPTGEGTAVAPDTINAPALATSPEPAPAPAASAASTASATGMVKTLDQAAKTVTIAHGPVDALKWPAMTMTFEAPNVDLGAIKHGDRVTFEFTSSGMDRTITAITRQMEEAD